MIEDRERGKLSGLEEAQGWRQRRRSASVTSAITEFSEVLTPLCTKGLEHLFRRKHRSRGDSISTFDPLVKVQQFCSVLVTLEGLPWWLRW